MKPVLLLGDFAQVSEGKLTVVGAGWTFTGPGPATFGIGVLVEVDWNEANKHHAFELALVDQDGQPVLDPGGNAVSVTGGFEVGRPPGHPEGMPLMASAAFNLAGLPLPAGSRFVWMLSVDGKTDDNWMVSFSTRPMSIAA